MRSTGRNKGVLSRALAILESFDEASRGLSLAELTRRSGLPKPTVHRLTAELCDLRLLQRDTQDGTYSLGLLLFELGELVPQSTTLSEAALPVMEDLLSATQQRVHLAILDGVDVVYVEILGAAGAEVTSRTGGRLPAHATGVGKVLLAYSPLEVIKARIDAGLPRLTQRTIATPGALWRELESIRSEGTAYDREESHVGVSCVAAPVFDGARHVRAGLSVTGPTRSIDPLRLGVAVRTAAFTLGRALRDGNL